MKYICLGYVDPHTFASVPESEFHGMMDDCFTYDDELRAKGHFTQGLALQPPPSAKTLHFKNKQVVVTDGPFAETKEQLGGILILEARDMDHAVELISKHPGVTFGPWEIRPMADLGEMMRLSDIRRGKTGEAAGS